MHFSNFCLVKEAAEGLLWNINNVWKEMITEKRLNFLRAKVVTLVLSLNYWWVQPTTIHTFCMIHTNIGYFKTLTNTITHTLQLCNFLCWNQFAFPSCKVSKLSHISWRMALFCPFWQLDSRLILFHWFLSLFKFKRTFWKAAFFVAYRATYFV